ncbi:unnamed protein product [Lactuca virosa]|uniref:Uncharacterized protein n=1 Tax=Lactuca virosa TaxID=75947 RepID=A0AAU9MKX9_9ASTR|nr:unnamed protein product [Lactuca virosa]
MSIQLRSIEFSQSVIVNSRCFHHRSTLSLPVKVLSSPVYPLTSGKRWSGVLYFFNRFCMAKEQMDASGDGDVKVVLDLFHDDSLSKAGFAHEVVNCIQELREISELEPNYPVEVYFKSLDDDTSASAQILKSQEAYIKEAIGSPLLDSTLISEHAVVIAEKTYRNISNCDFQITLTRQTLTFNDKAILDLYSGNAKYANALEVYLLSRDHFNLKTEFLVGINQIKVDCIEDLPDVDVVLGEHVFLNSWGLLLPNHQQQPLTFFWLKNVAFYEMEQGR